MARKFATAIDDCSVVTRPYQPHYSTSGFYVCLHAFIQSNINPLLHLIITQSMPVSSSAQQIFIPPSSLPTSFSITCFFATIHRSTTVTIFWRNNTFSQLALFFASSVHQNILLQLHTSTPRQSRHPISPLQYQLCHILAQTAIGLPGEYPHLLLPN